MNRTPTARPISPRPAPVRHVHPDPVPPAWFLEPHYPDGLSYPDTAGLPIAEADVPDEGEEYEEAA